MNNNVIVNINNCKIIIKFWEPIGTRVAILLLLRMGLIGFLIVFYVINLNVYVKTKKKNIILHNKIKNLSYTLTNQTYLINIITNKQEIPKINFQTNNTAIAYIRDFARIFEGKIK